MASLRHFFVMLTLFVVLTSVYYYILLYFLKLSSTTTPQQPRVASFKQHFHSAPVAPYICILLIVCDRFESFQSTIEQLIHIRYHTFKKLINKYPNDSYINLMNNIPIIISQDCNNMLIEIKIQTYVHNNIVQQHFRYPLVNEPIILKDPKHKPLLGYYKISRHYKWAIEQTFQIYPTIDKIIIVEDDLNFSEDFLEYFIALAPLFEMDDSIYCISAWNDNGKDELLDQKAISLLHRTDFFPGLGWMLKKSIWNQVKENWPPAFWDDWFRNWPQRQERVCIRPEISRTSTSGKKGVSKGQFFDKYLYFIHHFKGYYPFYDNQKKLLEQLHWQTYDRVFLDLTYNQTEQIHPAAMKQLINVNQSKSYRIIYYTQQEFIEYSSMFGLMSDFKFGVPRTAYKGIVEFYYQGFRVYLVPPIHRKIYLVSWS